MGEPSGGHAPLLPAEYIGWIERTEGTETSKYLQEEKAIAISLVAASEREIAQTDIVLKHTGVAMLGLWGWSGSLCIGTKELQSYTLDEPSGKLDHRR